MTAHILIVDDDVEALRLIGLMLERKGYTIHAAASGEQALQKVTEVTPDLIILDIMMPDMDGYTLAKHLRDQPATQNVPILFFTAKSDIDDKIAGFQAGGDDYLTKPIHPTELLSRIKVLLQRSNRQTAEAERGKLIAFLPVKGGIGNSTLALNTAILLSEQETEKKILLIEFRDGSGSIAMQLGSRSSRGLHDLTKERSLLTQQLLDAQLIRHSANLHVLAASSTPAGTTDPITETFTKKFLPMVLSKYDYVLLDLPTKTDKTMVPILHRADYILITMEPNRIALRLGKGVLEQLETLNIGEYKIKVELMSRAPSASAITRQTLEKEIRLEILGSIPPAPDLAYDSWSTGRPIVTIQPTSLLTQQIKIVVEDILKTL